MAEYGFAPAFLNTNPELKKLVATATAGGWELDKFLDTLKTTKWWKSRSDAQKRYDVAVAENPGQVVGDVQTAARTISRMLVTMGMNLSMRTVTDLARQAVRNGLSEAELRYLVGTKYHHGGTTGMIGKTRAELTEMAKQYGISATVAQQNNQIETVLQGVRTTADYETYYRDAAKMHFKAIASQLDAGFTTREILDPYIQMAAQELGVNPNTIDISQAKWNAPITYRGERPVSATEPRTMTFDEWTKQMRTDTQYGWDKTQNAQKQAATLSTQIMETFGAMG